MVLSWLSANPCQLKTFVRNHISQIIYLIPPSHWQHIEGVDNPANSASRGLLPTELLSCDLWWNGPSWLKHVSMNYWPKQPIARSKLHILINYKTCSCSRPIWSLESQFKHHSYLLTSI